jgi:hypothetical protein
VSWPGDGSITSGVPKKSRHCGHADGILIGCLRGRALTGQLNRFDANGEERFPGSLEDFGEDEPTKRCGR